MSAAGPDRTGAGRSRRITLLTDFGTADGYVAAMKGAIAAIAPFAIIDDASHDIPQGDLHAAAWALGAFCQLYPPGTVHVAVVDPGVGSERRALACELDGRFVVAPDNGVITHALVAATERRVFAMDTSRPFSSAPDHHVSLAGDTLGNQGAPRHAVSATFHGRDVFAPAAALILTGTPLEEIGSVVHDPVLIDCPAIERVGPCVRGVIVHIDRFGNLITNIPAAALNRADTGSAGTVSLVIMRGSEHASDTAPDGRDQMTWSQGEAKENISEIPLRRTYADVECGMPVALIGSRGTLEVSVRDGSAERLFCARRGDAVGWNPVPAPGRGTHYS